MKRAKRLEQIPPYLFAEIDRKRKTALAKGVDIISLGIGDPDQPPPANVIDKLCQEAHIPKNHRYPDYEGSMEFRVAVAQWYRSRFEVELDPEHEVMALIGSKEGLAHICWAFLDSGDCALVPDPAYPVYKTHALLAGAVPHFMPLRADRGFLPDLESIDPEVARRAKLMFLNYPNNPTAGVATLEFFEEAVAFCRQYDILLCHDSAYSEITFDGYRAPSPLQVEGAKTLCIEFGSLSKPFNMTGWRLGYAVGSAEALGALGVIKTNTDSGQFTAVQKAGIEALLGTSPGFSRELLETYHRRRDAAVEALRAIGLTVEPPKGTFYIWARVPDGYSSAEYAAELLEKTGVIVSPGSAYGEAGEGYFRISLTVDDRRLSEAMERIRRLAR
ncbi:MAG: LL-diaminopimelate aminotransferase [Bacillota bacterium]